jgi:hypothetical protein
VGSSYIKELAADIIRTLFTFIFGFTSPYLQSTSLVSTSVPMVSLSTGCLIVALIVS